MKKKDSKNSSDKVLPFNINHSGKNKKEEISLTSKSSGEQHNCDDHAHDHEHHHGHSAVKKNHESPPGPTRPSHGIIHADPSKLDSASEIILAPKRSLGHAEMEKQRLQEMEMDELLGMLRGNIEKIQTQSQRIDFYLEEIALTRAMENMNKKLLSGEE